MKINKKKKHVLTFFQSNQKKFKFYFKPRLFSNLILNKINIYASTYKNYILISLNSIYLKIKQILSCLKLIKNLLKYFLIQENSTLFILIFPDFQLTKKPKEVRMGRGKGPLAEKIVLLKRNSGIFLLQNINKFYAIYILNQCKYRLPIRTKIIYKYW